MNTAKFNPNVRSLYKDIIEKNIIHNPADNFEYLPPRYGPPLIGCSQPLIGGGRFRENALASQNGHYPSIEAVESSTMGGFYGRSPHNIRVGSGRRVGKCGGVAILKHRVKPALMHELDSDYLPASDPHGSGRPRRLTNAIKKRILEQHPDLMEHHLAGGKIEWKKIWNQIKGVAGTVGKVANNPLVQQFTPDEYKDTLKNTANIANTVSGMGRPQRLTNAIKQRILQQHPQLLQHHLAGGKINWTKIWNGIKGVSGTIGKVASHPLVQQYTPDEYKDTLKTTGDIANAIHGSGAKQFFKDFGTGFKKGFKGSLNVASKILPVVSVFQPELAPLAAASIGANKAFGGGVRRRAGERSGGKRFVKGSPEAKQFMAKLRSMRRQ